MIRDYRRYVVGTMLVHSACALAQPQEHRFQAGTPQAQLSAMTPRGSALEQAFFDAESWTFIHAVSDLPADTLAALRHIGATDIVGPGEPMDSTDAVRYMGRIQHLYTALSTDIGVTVWQTGGSHVLTHALLYDRRTRDACRYSLGRDVGAVLPLQPRLRAVIRDNGFDEGECQYLAPGSW